MRAEGLGVRSSEGWPSGARVTATPNTGSRELRGNSESGLRVPAAGFATRLCELLSDPDARARLTASGLARAQEYSQEKMLDRYEALMEKLCVRTVPANATTSH